MSLSMRSSVRQLFPVLLLAAGTSAFAANDAFKQCLDLFPNKTPPVVQESASLLVRDLCFDAFAILHSGTHKTPIYAVERISPEQLADAKDEVRTNRFFADARLRSSERATLEDYKGSGFDRGHMAPAGDMPTAQAMAQSFSLANMVPQAPENNRGLWAKAFECSTRRYVKRTGSTVYVFTGPVYSVAIAEIVKAIDLIVNDYQSLRQAREAYLDLTEIRSGFLIQIVGKQNELSKSIYVETVADLKLMLRIPPVTTLSGMPTAAEQFQRTMRKYVSNAMVICILGGIDERKNFCRKRRQLPATRSN